MLALLLKETCSNHISSWQTASQEDILKRWHRCDNIYVSQLKLSWPEQYSSCFKWDQKLFLSRLKRIKCQSKWRQFLEAASIIAFLRLNKAASLR